MDLPLWSWKFSIIKAPVCISHEDLLYLTFKILQVLPLCFHSAFTLLLWQIRGHFTRASMLGRNFGAARGCPWGSRPDFSEPLYTWLCRYTGGLAMSGLHMCTTLHDVQGFDQQRTKAFWSVQKTRRKQSGKLATQTLPPSTQHPVLSMRLHHRRSQSDSPDRNRGFKWW